MEAVETEQKPINNLMETEAPLLKRYLEADENEQKPIDNTMQTGLEIGNSSNSTGNSTTILLNEVNSEESKSTN